MAFGAVTFSWPPFLGLPRRRHRVTWRNKSDVRELVAKSVQVRFLMRLSTIDAYSFGE